MGLKDPAPETVVELLVLWATTAPPPDPARPRGGVLGNRRLLERASRPPIEIDLRDT